MIVSPRVIRQFLFWLVLGIAIYGAIIVTNGWDSISISLSALGIAGWLGVLGLSTFNIAIRFIRWQFYLQKMGHTVPTRPSLSYFIAGFAFISTPAKAGEAVRSVYLKQHGISYTDSLAALFVERLTDLIAVILLALAAALAVERMQIPVLIAAVVTLALLPIVHSQGLRSLLMRIQRYIRSDRIKAAIGHLLNLLSTSAALLKSGPLYTGMVLSLIAATAICASMALTLTLLDVEVSPFLASGIYACAILVGALSFLPGGIGSAEAVMGLGLLFLELEPALIASVIIVCRIAGMWYPIALGITTLLGLELRRKRTSTDNDSDVLTSSK